MWTDTIHYEFLSTLGGSGLIGNFYKQYSKGRISEQNLLGAKHLVKLGKLSHGYLKTVDAESMFKLYCVWRVILLNAEVNHAQLLLNMQVPTHKYPHICAMKGYCEMRRWMSATVCEWLNFPINLHIRNKEYRVSQCASLGITDSWMYTYPCMCSYPNMIWIWSATSYLHNVVLICIRNCIADTSFVIRS